MFNTITGINESKTLTKHISCECNCKFDRTKCNSNQWWNNDKCQCEYQNILYVKKIMSEVLLHVIMKMENIWIIQRFSMMKLKSHTMKK